MKQPIPRLYSSTVLYDCVGREATADLPYSLFLQSMSVKRIALYVLVIKQYELWRPWHQVGSLQSLLYFVLLHLTVKLDSLSSPNKHDNHHGYLSEEESVELDPGTF